MIKIDVWSDINCPFCYIGKRHLEQALEKSGKLKDVEINWKSFELDPEAQAAQGDPTELLAKKYGRDRKWAEEMHANVTEMAAMAGLDFHLEKTVPANSFNAHRLLHLAKQYKLQNELKEKLLASKFVDGKDIGNMGVLKEVAFAIGLDREEVERVLSSDKFAYEVRKDEKEAAQIGIRGVPFFVFNSKSALSGAHPVETFIEVLNSLDSNDHTSP